MALASFWLGEGRNVPVEHEGKGFSGFWLSVACSSSSLSSSVSVMLTQHEPWLLQPPSAYLDAPLCSRAFMNHVRNASPWLPMLEQTLIWDVYSTFRMMWSWILYSCPRSFNFKDAGVRNPLRSLLTPISCSCGWILFDFIPMRH